MTIQIAALPEHEDHGKDGACGGRELPDRLLPLRYDGRSIAHVRAPSLNPSILYQEPVRL